MGRYTGPKAKIARREGANVFGLAKITRVLTKRNYPPGIHGPQQGVFKKKATEYGIQLREKQKMKRTYEIRERQFKNYFVKASKQDGDAGINLHTLLERRLDNTLFRLGLAVSRAQARQIVTHALARVNDIKVTIPSFQVSIGDIISIREKSSGNQLFALIKEEKNKGEIPSWLSFEPKKLIGTVVSLPHEDELHGQFDLQRVIEFYSR